MSIKFCLPIPCKILFKRLSIFLNQTSSLIVFASSEDVKCHERFIGCPSAAQRFERRFIVVYIFLACTSMRRNHKDMTRMQRGYRVGFPAPRTSTVDMAAFAI